MDSIQQAIDEVLNASVAQYGRFEAEAFIRQIVADQETYLRYKLMASASTPQQKMWAERRYRHIAIAVAHAVEMMLRQELLPDEPASN
jgi:hypothetical protein